MAVARRLGSIVVLLYAVAILDELSSGVPSMGAPDIQRSFGLSYSATAIVMFLVPGAVALVVDPVVFLLADRYPRRWFIAGGLGTMALASFAAALAPGPVTLALSIAIWGVSTGAATSLAQATLVDRTPDQRGRTMARWTTWSYVGDLIAPLLFAWLASSQLGWRAAFVIVGGVLVVLSMAVWLRGVEMGVGIGTEEDAGMSTSGAAKVGFNPSGEAVRIGTSGETVGAGIGTSGEDVKAAMGISGDAVGASTRGEDLKAGIGASGEDAKAAMGTRGDVVGPSINGEDAKPGIGNGEDMEAGIGTKDLRGSLWQRLCVAARDRVLLLWLFGTALCDLLDEIFVVFASLHVRHELGAGPAWQGAILVAFSAGGALGLVVLDRLLVHRSERQLLVAAALACAISYVAWMLAPALWLSVALAGIVGATAAPLYPLAAAQAYARCPGQSGLVLAASHLFTPLGLALPFLIGLVADAAGTSVALALLLVQPLGLVWLARR